MKKIILFCLLLCLHQVQAQKSSTQHPNIVWIVCEDISPYLGCYGNTEVKTPNLDELAHDGVRYSHAYTTAGVCAPSRSSIITGMYQTSIGTQHMRTINGLAGAKYSPVPDYSAVLPDYVKCFPEYLRQAGYYCTNNEKQDYQFEPPVTVWDENGPAASWRNRPAGKPFFAVFNFFITHESQLFMREKDSLLVDPDKLAVPPYYPNTTTVRRGLARLYTNIRIMDRQAGELINMLKADGLYDNTILFFYSDHGGALPWMKREVLERGIHIPLIVKLPDGKLAGTVVNNMVSSVDFAPTVLSLAGVQIPQYMQGNAFLGAQKVKPRKYVFAGRDRMDTEYDRVRAARDQQYEYLYNYMPEKPYYQNIEYRKSIPMMREILALRDAGKLDSFQAAWFKTKPQEELYDIEADPNQLHNLAANPAYKTKLAELREALQKWSSQVGDLGALDEKEMITKWWDGKNTAPPTDTPTIVKTSNGLTVHCTTKGASIGYRIVKGGPATKPETHTVSSWDFGGLLNPNLKNGQQRPTLPAWQVYNGQPIKLSPNDTLIVNAMRIGYKPVVVSYIGGL